MAQESLADIFENSKFSNYLKLKNDFLIHLFEIQILKIITEISQG